MCFNEPTHTVRVEGQHKMDLCAEHVERYRDESGEGRLQKDGLRYIIEENACREPHREES